MADGFIVRKGGVAGEPAPIYTAATGGIIEEYDDGGKRYKSHTFTSSETFTVTQVGNGERVGLDYLVIAGGGNGGGSSSGGGGAGGYRCSAGGNTGENKVPESQIIAKLGSHSITVGAQGGDSSINFAAIFSFRGGNGNGGHGGSGAGGSPGGRGTYRQGKRGGNRNPQFGNPGGGGGALGDGQDGPSTGRGGNGGAGLANNLRTGLNITRAGGGGGSNIGYGGGSGGSGGGGGAGGNAAANTGSGGGGSGGQGGSGIVIIRYEIAPSV